MADSEITLKAGVKADAQTAKKAGEELAKATKDAAKNGRVGQGDASKTYVQSLTGALEKADKKLQGFHSLAAEKMRETVRVMRTEIAKGDIGKDMMGNLAGGLRRFLQMANRLPPDEFGEMQAELAEMVKMSDRLASSVKQNENAKIDFKVDVSGEDAIDEVRRKLDAIGKARKSIATLKELREECSKLTKDEIKALKPALDDLRERMESGDLGERNLKAAEKAADDLGKALLRMRPEVLERLGAKAQKLTDSISATKDAAQKLPDEFRHGFDISGIAGEFGVHVGTMERGIGSLISKIPGVKIGVAAFGAITGAIAAGIAVIGRYVSKIRELRREQEAYARERLSRNKGLAEYRMEQEVRDLEREATARKNATQAMRDQAAAAKELADAQSSIAAATARLGVRDSATLYDIDRREKQAKFASKQRNDSANIAADAQDVRTEMDKLDAKAASIEKVSRTVEGIRRGMMDQSAEAFRLFQRKYQGVGDDVKDWWERLKKDPLLSGMGFINNDMTADEAKAVYDQLMASQEDIVKQNASREKDLKDIDIERKALEEKLKNIEARRKIIEKEKELFDQQQKKEDEEETKRREAAKRQREWEVEDRDRNERREEEDFDYEKKNRFANHQQKMAMEKRRLDERKELYEQAQKALDEFNASIAGKSESELTPEQLEMRSRLQTRRDEERRRYQDTRRNVASLEAEGDARETAFRQRLNQGSNRLVALGIAGGGDNYAAETSRNTKGMAKALDRIVGMLPSLRGSLGGLGGARIASSGWGITNM